MSDPLRIPPRFRLALAGKGALLGAMTLLFLSLAVTLALGETRPMVARVVFTPPLVLVTVFLAWTSGLAWADVLAGQARVVRGAAPLPSRKSGVSVKLPDGHFAEYVFHNPWKPLEQGHSYTVTIGRFSRVMVAEPVDEGVSRGQCDAVVGQP